MNRSSASFLVCTWLMAGASFAFADCAGSVARVVEFKIEKCEPADFGGYLTGFVLNSTKGGPVLILKPGELDNTVKSVPWDRDYTLLARQRIDSPRLERFPYFNGRIFPHPDGEKVIQLPDRGKPQAVRCSSFPQGKIGVFGTFSECCDIVPGQGLCTGCVGVVEILADPERLRR